MRSSEAREGPKALIGRALRRSTRFARFWRGGGPAPSPLFLDRRRIFVLPTREGIILAVLLWLMLLGSINYGVSLGMFFTFLVAGTALISVLHTFGNLSRLFVRAGRTEPVFAGETATFTLVLEDDTSRGRWALRVRLPGETASTARVDVPGDVAVVRIHRRVERRGCHPLGRVTLETRFPLGLFRAWAPLELSEARCVVYPRPEPHAAGVPTSGRVSGRGAGGEFEGLRSYAPGDSPGRIHWKASARADDLLAKEYGDESAVLWLDWEETAGADRERRLSILCRRALDAHASGRVWGLRIPGFSAGPDRGGRHLHRCLEALALWEAP